MDVKAELRQALERQEFLLHFQPIIALSDNRLAAVEALVRWQHPRRGLMAPYTFIPDAEASGFIVPLDLWVLREACSRARQWKSIAYPSPAPMLNVNLSARYFQEQNVVGEVLKALQETEFEPDRLELEITESTKIADLHGAARTIQGLKRLGIRVAIDDFGSGYSSLSYLHTFEIDTLKIDQSLIRPDSGASTRKIAEAIVGLAHSLGMTAIAEGVETEEQLQLVRATNCDFAQGYYFYPPMPADQLQDLIRAGQTSYMRH